MQDNGRGRQGRAWESPIGNLYASTIIEIKNEDPDAATLSFVIALAVYDLLLHIAPGQLFQIKWPNDILSRDGAKLSGILLERKDSYIVAGIGVNLSHYPDLPDRKTASIQSLGSDPPAPNIAVSILAEYVQKRLWDWRTSGLAATLRAWQQRAHPLGTMLYMLLPDGSRYEGSYAGLTAQGALQLRLANDEIHVIHAGDIFQIEN